MRKVVFPPVHTATAEGLVAIGGDLEVDTMMTAYLQGIFPWPVSPELPLAWFSPDPRGVLDLNHVHVSRTLNKFLKKTSLTVTFNQAFDEVISACAKTPRTNQSSTWITQDIIQGYERLFKQELAYSVEVWNKKILVAGLYGVCIGEFISGESMFTHQDNASKLALFQLVQRLRDKNITWMDTQMVTPVVENFGGKYIPRQLFLEKISKLNWQRKRSEIF